MPSIEENVEKWGEAYEWPHQGDEWSAAWGGPETQWAATLLPRIGGFLPARRILEIAPGYGRWTQFLLDHCQTYVGVDIAQNCVDACRQRFAEESRATFHVNDGVSLGMVAVSSVDFAFSFDSLVHAERDTLAGYAAELGRVLAPEGVAFLHHSNMKGYLPAHRRSASFYRLGQRARLLQQAFHRLELTGWTHWRATSMDAAAMVEAATQAGLRCVGQELVCWGGERRLIDCFSVIARPGSRWDRPLVVEHNPRFMGEVYSAGHLSRVFSGLGRPRDS